VTAANRFSDRAGCEDASAFRSVGEKEMKLKTAVLALGIAFSANAALALTAEEIVLDLQGQGYTRVEVKVGATQIKVEAIRGTEKSGSATAISSAARAMTGTKRMTTLVTTTTVPRSPPLMTIMMTTTAAVAAAMMTTMMTVTTMMTAMMTMTMIMTATMTMTATTTDGG
jgi:hypothetical protein